MSNASSLERGEDAKSTACASARYLRRSASLPSRSPSGVHDSGFKWREGSEVGCNRHASSHFVPILAKLSRSMIPAYTAAGQCAAARVLLTRRLLALDVAEMSGFVGVLVHLAGLKQFTDPKRNPPAIPDRCIAHPSGKLGDIDQQTPRRHRSHRPSLFGAVQADRSPPIIRQTPREACTNESDGVTP
jgi:hypothetical protein